MQELIEFTIKLKYTYLNCFNQFEYISISCNTIYHIFWLIPHSQLVPRAALQNTSNIYILYSLKFSRVKIFKDFEDFCLALKILLSKNLFLQRCLLKFISICTSLYSLFHPFFIMKRSNLCYYLYQI